MPLVAFDSQEEAYKLLVLAPIEITFLKEFCRSWKEAFRISYLSGSHP